MTEPTETPTDPQPETPGPEVPPLPDHEPDAHRRIRTMRVDWWRLASHRPGEQPEPGADAPATDEERLAEQEALALADRIVKGRKAPAPPADDDGGAPTEDADPAPDGGEQPPERALGRWDPVAIAERMVRAHQDQPVQARVASLADAARWAKPRAAQAAFTLSGVWVAWHGGLTPGLISVISGAPLGVSLGLVLLGWAIRRRSASSVLPVAWCGQCAFTTTVIAAVLN